jgi:mRNA interferase MazF
MISADTPQRGEVWMVNFDPTIGTEIRKIRPAAVISSNTIGVLPIKLVAPITDWKDWMDRVTMREIVARFSF